MTEPDDRDENLIAQIAALRAQMEVFNNHRFVRVINSRMRTIGWQFMRGLAFGLGSVIGATILVSVLVYMLSNINFIPILGDWATQIVNEITSGNGLPEGNPQAVQPLDNSQ